MRKFNWKFWHGKPAVQKVKLPKGSWHVLTNKLDITLKWERYGYVNESGRILTEVLKFNGSTWTVSRNGGIYGEYLTKDAAMTRAEEIA